MINSVLSLFKLEIFIERMPLACGPLSFSHEMYATDYEFWFLGLHVVISSLQVFPQ